MLRAQVGGRVGAKGRRADGRHLRDGGQQALDSLTTRSLVTPLARVAVSRQRRGMLPLLLLLLRVLLVVVMVVLLLLLKVVLLLLLGRAFLLLLLSLSLPSRPSGHRWWGRARACWPGLLHRGVTPAATATITTAAAAAASCHRRRANHQGRHHWKLKGALPLHG